MAELEKKERFERLAEKRVNEVVKKLRVLGNLSNKRNYYYDESHLKQMFNVLDSEIKDLKDKFKSDDSSGSLAFKFK